MVEHTATLRYDARLIGKAVFAFWRRSMGYGVLAATAVLAAIFAWRLAAGDRSWLIGLVATGLALALVMPIAVFVAHRRNSMNAFRGMKTPEASFVAREASFTMTSDRGSSTLEWSTVTEVWCFEAFWLLLFSKAQFATIPLRDVPEPMRTFVLERVRAAGGQVHQGVLASVEELDGGPDAAFRILDRKRKPAI